MEAENLDETPRPGSNHPRMNGKFPFLPLNPHHPTPTGDSCAGGAEKQIPVSSVNQSQLEAWKLRSNARAADPGLVRYLDFEATDVERGVIHNRAPGADAHTDATFIGGEWTQGRWPGKSEVAFQRVGDLIRISLLTHLDAAPFIVSLRIEPESPLTQAILLTPDVGPGQLYRLISGHEKPNRGNGTVFIKTGGQPKNLRFASNRPLMRAELGQWHRLAVVYDPANHRVRHYPNGVLVKESPLDDAHPLKLRQLVIGKWCFTTEPRNFAGRMDELAVFKRALSGEEIAKFSTPLLPPKKEINS